MCINNTNSAKELLTQTKLYRKEGNIFSKNNIFPSMLKGGGEERKIYQINITD